MRVAFRRFNKKRMAVSRRLNDKERAGGRTARGYILEWEGNRRRRREWKGRQG